MPLGQTLSPIEHLMNAVYPKLSSDEKVAAPRRRRTTGGLGAPQATGSMMNSPAQVPEPAMAGTQLPHDVSSNGSPEPHYDASDWQADYGVDVRRATLAGGFGRHAGHRALHADAQPRRHLGHR